MTNFAITLWLYQKTGSALQTALLSICSYAPYVVMSIFAGALSDRWDKKKTMLACDALAACCTVTVFLLLSGGWLRSWHLYLLNSLNGLMNTVQSPAGDVALTLLVSPKHYQKASGLRSFSGALNTMLHPVLATSLYAAGGLPVVIAVDLTTFAVAFCALLFFIRIPQVPTPQGQQRESLWHAAKGGLRCLAQNKTVLLLILFLAGVNFIASAFDATLPAFILPRSNGGEQVLGLVTSFAGVALLAGSLLVMVLPPPKDRIRLIVLTLLFSLTADNFLMSLTRLPALWCVAQLLGYLPIPLMNASLDVIVRSSIPAAMQGRVYACRNTLQFFTIPLGSIFGGWMVDAVCEPLMARVASDGTAVVLFGAGKGFGTALMIFLLGLAGAALCLIFGWLLRRCHYLEKT